MKLVSNVEDVCVCVCVFIQRQNGFPIIVNIIVKNSESSQKYFPYESTTPPAT